MNRLVRLLLLSFPIVGLNAHAAEQRVQDLALDDHTVYQVPVSGPRGRTVGFPCQIMDVAGAEVDVEG